MKTFKHSGRTDILPLIWEAVSSFIGNSSRCFSGIEEVNFGNLKIIESVMVLNRLLTKRNCFLLDLDKNLIITHNISGGITWCAIMFRCDGCFRLLAA